MKIYIKKKTTKFYVVKYVEIKTFPQKKKSTHLTIYNIYKLN